MITNDYNRRDLQEREVKYLNATSNIPEEDLETSYSLSSTMYSMRNKRYRNKTTSSLNASLDALAPLPVGYSILEFISEDLGLLQGSKGDESPYKRNPKKILRNSFQGTNGDISRSGSNFLGYSGQYSGDVYELGI